MKAHLYVFDGFADWEPSFTVSGLHNPQFQREPGRWQVKTVGQQAGTPVVSMGGVTVMPDMALAELRPDDSDLLILPGGEGWEDSDAHDPVIRKAATWLDHGRWVAAICGATAGLARAGLLDERRHTSNAAAYLKGTGYHGGDGYVDEDVVRDGWLITAGGMAPLEFAREIFAAIGLYEDEALAAWYQLYKTGKSEYFARLQRAASDVATT